MGLYNKAEADMIQEMLQSKRSIEVLSEIDSTNTYLLSHLKNGHYRRAVIAHRQTGGKGRLGRSFYSPEGVFTYLLIRRFRGMTRSFSAF